jgi:hypothetical protein
VQVEEKLKEAQKIMVECGAFSYCFEQFFKRVGKARKVLASMKLPDTSEFEEMENHILHAPRKILIELGVEDVEGIIAGRA